MISILPPTREQIRRASEVMARAFFRDPLYQYLIPDEARRKRLLPSFQDITIRYALRYGEVYTTPSLDGLACWLSPGHTTPTWWGMCVPPCTAHRHRSACGACVAICLLA